MPTKRNGIFYFRRAIPKALQAKLNRKEIKFSLNTRDKLQALHLEWLCAIKVNEMIEKAKAGMEFPKGPLFNFEKSNKTFADKDGNQGAETSKRIDPETIKAFSDAGVPPELLLAMAERFLQAESPTPQIATRQHADPHINALNDTTLGEFIARYTSEYAVIHKQSLNTHIQTHLRRLTDIIDPNLPIADFSLVHAGHVRDKIIALPAQNRKYASLTVNQTIEAAHQANPEYNRLTAKTANDHLDTYRALFSKAVADKVYPERANPFQEIRVAAKGVEARAEAKRKALNKHQPFSDDDLTAMFSTRVHMAYGSNYFHEQFKYWIPLIGLLTGSRMSQIASLYCEDIRKQNDIWVIDFNENSPDKIAKTSASLRVVPMHPLLEKLGLPAFASRVAGSGQKRLFPELSNFHRNTYAKRFEDWFNRTLLIETGVRENTLSKEKTFHSFRATLLDLLKQAGLEESVRNQIIGWTKNEDKGNNVARNHYDSPNLKVMLDAVSKIKLPTSLEQLPPFPGDIKLKFTRPTGNQHTRKSNADPEGNKS
ncbi:site-specific integrase [Methylophaga pinxianii]|uniref:site-specific integrase n=1 Tax=Methylophaga pinxianii TaxID=2881052 RepID=UPI001CF167E3|nr:site-specific integrase [Methylophaga pinxianii]MCB2427128.1 site-specific integrase [Methylophaga pinxianii]UPH44969.1 site-specific integrase [Methylophaga pinxianii]